MCGLVMGIEQLELGLFQKLLPVCEICSSSWAQLFLSELSRKGCSRVGDTQGPPTFSEEKGRGQRGGIVERGDRERGSKWDIK